MLYVIAHIGFFACCLSQLFICFVADRELHAFDLVWSFVFNLITLMIYDDDDDDDDTSIMA